MTKGEITYNGNTYPTLDVYCPTLEETVTLAEENLWRTIESDYYRGDKTADNIDCSIYFYCEDGKLDTFKTQEDVEQYFRDEVGDEF